jgi:hypothetical protein
MKTNLVRSTIALAISISGVFLSYYFLYPDSNLQKPSKKLIVMAKVISVLNDVKKQGLDKFVWEPIRKGDLLYLGEKLKTSPNSSSKIEFVDNGAMIDIEPDSLIVVNKNNQKLSLQVVEGSLFVSSNKNITNLSVTSGDKQENTVNIKNGDFSYSVSKEGKANVEVLKGEVDSKSSMTSQSSQKFKELKPSYGENILIDLKSNMLTTYKWSPLSDDYDVKLEIGNNRNALQTENNATVENANGIIKTKAIAGTYYWRLVAQNKKNPEDHFSSSTFKVSYKQKVAPLPIFPTANETIQLKIATEPIEFKWSLMHNFDSIRLEIFEDNNKLTPILSEEVTNQTFYSSNKINRPGKFHWKLIGKIPSNSSANGPATLEEDLISTTQYFQINIGEDLQSPIQLSPNDLAIIYTSDKITKSIRNLHLTWKNVKEAKEYLVTIINKDNIKREFKVNINEFIIPSLSSGTYSWSIQSINLKNELSKTINLRTFSIEPTETLTFKEMENKIFYTTQFPTYKFLWSSIAKAESYRLRISQSPDFSQNENFQIKDSQFLYQIGKEGIYYAQVGALNKEENTIAQSDTFTFTVTKPPLPLTPQFIESSNQVEASPNGDIFFELLNYDKKLRVLFEIRDSKGALIDQAKTQAPKVFFKSIAPGTFFVTAKYIDELNQSSEISDRKKFIVPEKSAIAAPKVKGLKVR